MSGASAISYVLLHRVPLCWTSLEDAPVNRTVLTPLGHAGGRASAFRSAPLGHVEVLLLP